MKKYTIEISEDGKSIRMTRKNDGFSTVELIGFMEMVKQDLINQCKGLAEDKVDKSNNNHETANGTKPVLSAVVFPQILEKWDTAIVDLNRNNGMFKFDNVRLRNCSLHFSEREYYVRYRDVTFGGFDVYNFR